MLRPAQSMLRFVGVILAVASLPSFAAAEAQWHAVHVRQTAHVHFYVDSASLKPGKPVSQVRLMYDFAEPQFNEEFGTYSKSYVVDSQLNCTHRQIAAARMSLYTDNGAKGRMQGQTSQEKSPKWASAPPGSINGDIVDTACSLLQARH